MIRDGKVAVHEKEMGTMDWIEQNLDAYRVIAEILTDLRPLVRERLEAAHGKEWFKDGIPESVFENLIQNKEQEASIDWYENRYQEVISYAVFPDLFDIILANRGLFDPIIKLAPSQSLLNTRFLELEVMRAKIGRGRQVSEAEINFLTSFHLRFRRAIQELKTDDSPVPQVPPVKRTPESKTPSTPPGKPNTESLPDSVPPEEPEPEPMVSEESELNEIEIDEPSNPEPAEGPGRPPMRMASPTAPPKPTKPVEPPSDMNPAASTEEPENSEAEKENEPPKKETPAATVKRALEQGDDQAILRELYREITGIAEVIWTTNEIPTTRIWDRVSVTSWYETGFSRLELRPLSDFYELISQVRKKREAGASKKDIQTFLNDSKFATTLLSLRDMFQQNGI